MAVSHRGAISFALVHIPVGLYTATQDNDIHFNQICREDGSSRYYFDRRTKDWIKIKYLQDDDFIVLCFVPKENSMNSIILGQYKNDQLIYKGHVTLGVGGEPFRKIKALDRTIYPFSDVPKGNENAVWVIPELVCTVKYMMKTENGGMRQPVFKGLREDKSPRECIEK